MTRKAEEKWGSGIVEQVSLDLQAACPESKGFSPSNLWRMKQWYLFYAKSAEKLARLGREIIEAPSAADDAIPFPDYFAFVPWKHHVAIIRDIETAAERTRTKVIIIDNLICLCNSSDKGVDAGIIMMKLMALKKKRDLSLLIISHTPKRDLSSPITRNHLAGSKNLRYIKQVKVRAGAFRYDAGNVTCKNDVLRASPDLLR